jgi:hypothetical protein
LVLLVEISLRQAADAGQGRAFTLGFRSEIEL